MNDRDPLADACEAWQGGRDGGSTPLRAAARVLTGVPHYFSAPFIDSLDVKAMTDEVGQARARTLISAVAQSTPMTADEWRSTVGLTGTGQASRGIAAKVDDPDVDRQIEDLLTTDGATIAMPLWGFSLSESVSLGYGSRFVFRLVGAFHAVPAWVHSGVLPGEQELIGSGVYRVVDRQVSGASLIVDLEQIGHTPITSGGSLQ